MGVGDQERPAFMGERKILAAVNLPRTLLLSTAATLFLCKSPGVPLTGNRWTFSPLCGDFRRNSPIRCDRARVLSEIFGQPFSFVLPFRSRVEPYPDVGVTNGDLCSSIVSLVRAPELWKSWRGEFLTETYSSGGRSTLASVQEFRERRTSGEACCEIM